MGKKVFISYSHGDEQFKESFEEHLSVQKRNGVIDVWHDREIRPSEDWKGQIDENLDASDIIVFLVSPSFLASDYCYDVEMERAIERKTLGQAEILTVIVRSCDWKATVLGKYQALPKDGLPIRKWDDEDEAWLSVVDGLKQSIENFSPVSEDNSISELKIEGCMVEPEFQLWLDDTEVILTHRKVDRIKLDDVFVIPDIEVESDKYSDNPEIQSARLLIEKPGHYLVHGEEQQGKTTMLKYLFKQFAKDSKYPVLIDASNVKKSDYEKIIKRAFEEQYINQDYDLIDHKKIILLIDNLESCPLRERFRDELIDSFNVNFTHIIQTCSTSYSYIEKDSSIFEDYTVCELLGLGHQLREEMALKWISLGQVETISESDLYGECDDVKNKLNTIIKKNIVPPKPLYVLMLLQLFEANSKLDIEMTSYGHCYQQLIYQCLERANVKKDEFDGFINVLTEYAWLRFELGGLVNKEQVDNFFRKYDSEFLFTMEQAYVLKKLTQTSILKETSIGYDFKYPYLYYFFVGKKIAEGYSEDSNIQRAVEQLLKTLHREDSANILVFISHHTKDRWLLDKVGVVLNNLFNAQKPATLSKSQLSFMREFIQSIPQLVIEQRSVHEEREAQNKRLDSLERAEVSRENTSAKETDESLEILANINQTFKGMELAGQLIRSRHSSIKKSELLLLAENASESGLRFLEYFFEISKVANSEIIKLIAELMSTNPEISDSEVQENAKQAYLQLSYGVIHGFIRKIGSSIGSKEALQIYDELDKKHDTPAYTLIKQAIELHFVKGLDTDSIGKAAKKLRENPVCLRILKEMVIQHIYLFPVPYQDKQKLYEHLGLPLKSQQLMAQKKRAKG